MAHSLLPSQLQIPSFKVGFLAGINFRKEFGSRKPSELSTTLALVHPRINLGTWLTKTVLPILEEIEKAIGPVIR